ncbi:hypothetical protein HRbin27_01830 [bacterium HR27]|nr:hypothetical protein HRbin27_01830 [bacterium HR27]
MRCRVGHCTADAKADRRYAIGPGEREAGEDGGRPGRCCIPGTEIADDVDLDAEERAIAPERSPHPLALVASVVGRDEALGTSLDPLDGSLELPGQCSDERVFRVQTALGPEGPTDVGQDDANLVFRNTEHRRDPTAERVRRLRRCPDRQLPVDGVVVRCRSAGFHEGSVHALVDEFEFDDFLRLAEDCLDVTVLVLPGEGNIVRPIRMEPRCLRAQCFLRVDHRGQLVVFDDDLSCGVEGSCP